MSEQSFWVLSALTGEPLHGYGVLREIETLSGGRLRLSVGTLYGILSRLTADGSIEVDREVVVSSRLRRYYRLTAEGRQALAAEAARIQANARIASARLRTSADGV